MPGFLQYSWKMLRHGVNEVTDVFSAQVMGDGKPNAGILHRDRWEHGHIDPETIVDQPGNHCFGHLDGPHPKKPNRVIASVNQRQATLAHQLIAVHNFFFEAFLKL